MQNANYPEALTQAHLRPGQHVIWHRRDDQVEIKLAGRPYPDTLTNGGDSVQVWVVRVVLEGEEVTRMLSELGARPFPNGNWHAHNYLTPVA